MRAASGRLSPPVLEALAPVEVGVPRSRKSDDEEDLNDDVEPGADDADDEQDAFDLAAEEPEDDLEVDFEDVPASQSGRASASRLLDLLLESKQLALHAKKPGKALIEKVARVLESPLPARQKASKITDAIVESDDVDELFLDDETLAELLRRW